MSAVTDWQPGDYALDRDDDLWQLVESDNGDIAWATPALSGVDWSGDPFTFDTAAVERRFGPLRRAVVRPADEETP